jgi:F-type H+-transporting ATPase subunit b
MILQAQNQARAEADKIMSEAREQIRQEKEAALRDIRKEVAIVSMAIAEKVVRKDLSSEDGQKKLLDTLVNEMKELQ